ncbi:MAG: calcium-binding protein [archaeon]
MTYRKENQIEETDKRILEVLKDTDKHDIMKALRAWKIHLEKNLLFPFDAVIFEEQEEDPLKAGDRVSVLRIDDSDDLYGLLAEIRFGRRKYYFPLCDLEVTKKRSPNYQPVSDYCVWFVNRDRYD